MKVVFAFDSYKGCLAAEDLCQAAAEAWQAVCPQDSVVMLPLSDGGEGLVACMSRASADGVWHTVHADVMGPTDQTVSASYLLSADGRVACMEMAQAAGLSLVPLAERAPERTTTYGVGQMMADAVRRGAQHVLMGLGGSATCDAGEGMLRALQGVSLQGVRITAACDVDSPLYGPRGAACVFAPQKGASPQQVERLEARLQAFARRSEVMGVATPQDALAPGAGAAGGLGYALRTHLHARLCPGIDVLLDQLAWEQHLADAHLVITGEGCSDRQTLMGKVPMGVLRRSGGVPVVLVSGRIEEREALLAAGFARVLSINEGEGRIREQVLLPQVARENLRMTVASLAKEFTED